MVVRRYSYLGRQRILQQHVAFSLAESNGKLGAKCRIDLQPYELPADGKVFVEAYRLETYLRFSVGTVSQLEIPERLDLSEFEYAEGIKFRVKIANDTGVLIAEADKIQPGDSELPENRLPLITPFPADLGEMVYKLDLDGVEPRLLVNSNIGDWRALTTNPFFKSIVFPAVVREVLTQVLIIDNHSDTTDLGDWKSQWLKFGTLMPGVPLLSSRMSEEQKAEWIDAVCQSFSRKFKSFSSMQAYLTK